MHVLKRCAEHQSQSWHRAFMFFNRKFRNRCVANDVFLPVFAVMSRHPAHDFVDKSCM